MTIYTQKTIKNFDYEYTTKEDEFGRDIWVQIARSDIPPCINMNQEKEMWRGGSRLKSCRHCKYKLYDKCLLYKARWRRI